LNIVTKLHLPLI